MAAEEGQDRISKALALASYFVSGCLAINVSQVLGAPLSLINKEWHESWVAFSKQSFAVLTMTMTQRWAPTVVRVSGDASMRGQLFRTTRGELLCNFPKRIVMMANHQIYTDWLYLWWIAYSNGMHGRIYIILKESLKRIPVVGWGMQLCQFIFLKRNWEADKANIALHMKRLSNVEDPMWLLLFPEGTNLASSTREASKKWADKNGIKDLQHLLLPRSTGLRFCLQELEESLGYVYDCTIAYDGVPRGQYAQDIYSIQASYVDGKPPKIVNMHWRRFALSTIPIHDHKAFELWLRARWMEKDSLMETFYRTGRFPADAGVTKVGGKTRRGAGYIDAEIKPNRWYEFLQVFMPMGLLAMVLYSFYGALPKSALKNLNKQNFMEKIGQLQQTGLPPPQKDLLINTASKAVGVQSVRVQKGIPVDPTPNGTYTTKKLGPPAPLQATARPKGVPKLPPKKAAAPVKKLGPAQAQTKILPKLQQTSQEKQGTVTSMTPANGGKPKASKLAQTTKKTKNNLPGCSVPGAPSIVRAPKSPLSKGSVTSRAGSVKSRAKLLSTNGTDSSSTRKAPKPPT